MLAGVCDKDAAHSSSSGGTTSTGRRLLWTTPFDTLPSAAETPVSPREPTTIAAHACWFAASRTAIQPGPTARSDSPVASKPDLLGELDAVVGDFGRLLVGDLVELGRHSFDRSAERGQGGRLGDPGLPEVEHERRLRIE